MQLWQNSLHFEQALVEAFWGLSCSGDQRSSAVPHDDPVTLQHSPPVSGMVCMPLPGAAGDGGAGGIT